MADDMAKPEPKLHEILAAVNAVSGQINILEAINRVSTQVANLDAKVTLTQEAIMAAIDDVNAKLDALVALVNKVGEDLAAEIAAVGTPSGGLSAAQTAGLMTRLSSISDQLTAIDATMPVPPTA